MKRVIPMAALAALMLALPLPSQSATSDGLVPMSMDEVSKLYRGKTWMWPGNGAGYMSADGEFKAWTRTTDKNLLIAHGTWGVFSKGRMCFEARWRGTTGASSARTCFQHAVKNGAIWQKKEPNGEWYIFKHRKTEEGDEYSNLRQGRYLKIPD